MTSSSNWCEHDGFRYQLFPAKTEKPESLIIYLHGVNNVAEIDPLYLRFLQSKIPNADVIALQAPIKVIKSAQFPDPKGYSWFPFGESLAVQIGNWFNHLFKRLTIAGQVEDFARDQLAQRGLTEKNLAYYGHSMGGIVALQTGLSGDKEVAAIVSSNATVVPFSRVKNKSKVFLQMGEKDELFNVPRPPPPKGFLKRVFSEVADRFSLRHNRSIARLKRQHVELTEKVYPRQTHAQDYRAWQDAVDYMAKALAKPKPP